MPNMKNIINNHNNMIIKNNRTNPPTPGCNCRIQNSCPLNGKCLTTELVYQATVTGNDNQQEETYIGLTENTFKTRYNGHTSSFKNEEKKNFTTLSQYIWSLKEKKIAITMKWKIISKANSYRPPNKNAICVSLKNIVSYVNQIWPL